MSLVTQIFRDEAYECIPWKDGGDSLEGVDCRGLALIWLKQEMGFVAPSPGSHEPEDEVAERIIREHIQQVPAASHECQRGDVIFLRQTKTGLVRHVAVALGNNRFLHILKGADSRIENGFTLMRRVGLEPVGVITPAEAEWLAKALSDRRLGDPTSIILFVVGLALSAASSFLISKPKLGQFRNETGRYGFDNLLTRSDPQMPLPDILGVVSVAGNSPYQSIVDKSQVVSNPTQQKANKVVILASGPIDAVTYLSQVMKVNGRAYTDTYWHASGIKLDPAQSKAEAVEGTISSEYNRPSVSLYTGAHAISVPVDVRAQYDRNFPLYGFSGAGYVVFRLIDSTKFDQFNLNTPVKGRHCRTYTSSGFTTTSVSAESLTGADGTKVRFKLAGYDVISVTAVSVNGTAYTEAAAANQSGNVYRVNALKGYVEFITAPAAAATITIDYSYYPRAWTQNPASQVVYLLTEAVRGKGLPAAKIDWTAAVAARDYFDGQVAWQNQNGAVFETRSTSNYALDSRKPVQDHVRAVLDAGYAYLFLSNGKFVVKPRRDGSSVMSFTTANILRDSFSAELVDRSQLANRVKVFFHAAETFNAETEVVRDDVEDQASREDWVGNEGVVEETLRMLAVDRESHAERLAETILRENINASWLAEWKTTVKGLALEPGDVVDVTHPSQPDWAAKLFRVEEITVDEEGRHTLRCSEYFAAAYV